MIPVPAHKQCSRHICENERTAEGGHQYCSEECARISREIHGGPLTPAPEWSWAPGVKAKV